MQSGQGLRRELLRFVWGNRAAAGGDVRTVDVHVRRLREKIEPSPSDRNMYIRNGAWGIISGFGNVERTQKRMKGALQGSVYPGSCSFSLGGKGRWAENEQTRKTKNRIRRMKLQGKQEEPGQIVSEKVEKKREETRGKTKEKASSDSSGRRVEAAG